LDRVLTKLIAAHLMRLTEGETPEDTQIEVAHEDFVNLGPISPAIMGFFTRFLKGSSAEPTFTPMRLARPADIQVTPTGQVSTSIGGETVYSINRNRADSLIAHRAPQSMSHDDVVEPFPQAACSSS
jgi:hypothetical protein